ncbi:MAG: hypothetical protein WBF89_01505 [Steroidobacteraceae bacterium]
MSDPAYLRNLKEYSRAQFGTEYETEAVVGDLDDESDRTAILVAATAIEDALEQALMQRMPALATDNDARVKVFGPEGTISTYSAKILIAYAIGILDRKARKEIDVVRHIRNACAHSRKSLSLQTPALADAIKGALGEDVVAKLRDQEPATLRRAFICHIAALIYQVLSGKRIPIWGLIEKLSE